MNILDKITQHKRGEVISRMHQKSIQELQESETYFRECNSMKEAIRNGSGIIAEFKRQSPSKGIINSEAKPEIVASEYTNAGVSGVSVLTDEAFFGGKDQDLLAIKEVVATPVLRKDFVIDSYQIHEAKALGADVILLIARILNPDQTKEFTEIAHGLGLEVLLETHSEQEIEKHYFDSIDLIGINNRDLDTFQVDIENSIRLAQSLPKESIKIAESGLGNPETVIRMKENGFDGFLMGEAFMKHTHPGKACKKFIEQLKPVSHEN